MERIILDLFSLLPLKQEENLKKTHKQILIRACSPSMDNCNALNKKNICIKQKKNDEPGDRRKIFGTFSMCQRSKNRVEIVKKLA